jgi:hypothetical protein
MAVGLRQAAAPRTGSCAACAYCFDTKDHCRKPTNEWYRVGGPCWSRTSLQTGFSAERGQHGGEHTAARFARLRGESEQLLVVELAVIE